MTGKRLKFQSLLGTVVEGQDSIHIWIPVKFILEGALNYSK